MSGHYFLLRNVLPAEHMMIGEPSNYKQPSEEDFKFRLVRDEQLVQELKEETLRNRQKIFEEKVWFYFQNSNFVIFE